MENQLCKIVIWTTEHSCIHINYLCSVFLSVFIVNLFSFVQTQRKDTYVWERYGKYDLSDPFLALQRDNEALWSSPQGRGNGARGEADSRRSNPLTMLRLVVGHCRRMQEKMLQQLAAAESRHRRVSQTVKWSNK